MRSLFSLDSLIFILSFLLSFLAVYRKLPINNLQQISGVLLVLLLLLLNRISDSKTKSTKIIKINKLIFLFISSIFVQILIISTGNIYSPFLILIHLYSLGVSFLISLSAAMLFLVLSLELLILNVYFTPLLYKQFSDDPGSTLLYLTSFMVIVPLSFLISRYYRLKDAVLSVLNKEMKLSSQRQESVFSGVNELVFVTDLNLNIISANQAVERMLKLADFDLNNKNLLSVVSLKDSGGAEADLHSLAIERILLEKNARIIEGYFLLNKSDQRLIPVTVQIRPISDLEGKVSQLVFVLTDPQSVIEEIGHANLEPARKKQKDIAKNLKKALEEVKLNNVLYQVSLFDKNEDDLLNAYELEDHPIKEKIAFEDVALICSERVNEKQELASGFRVKVIFRLGESEMSEKALLNIKRSEVIDNSFFTNSDFSAPIDSRWFRLLMDKLLDLGILIASFNSPGNKVEVMPYHEEGKVLVAIKIKSEVVFSSVDQQDLFREYYGNLGSKTNLKMGSGLEGFIARSIATQLNLPLLVGYDQVNKSLNITVEMRHQPG